MTYKLGSLFDGSGGFPLAGVLCGIEPVWASEVEPYPIAVTRSRFPNVKHLGDIGKIHGGEIEPVDIITFGSPCQDLSVAGKRAGIKHEANGDEETTRSGLFMEAVRIIKEMRKATGGRFPRFALWENVPGAFSSQKGEDFRVVLEELIKIVEPSAVMPGVPSGGWAYADSYRGDGWSLAYRVFDAQYWGVPQRRRRIHLVADFRGQCAQEILLEREGVRGYFAPSGAQGQTAPADAQGGAGADDREGEGFDGYNGDLTGNVAATLGVNCGVSTGRNGVVERGRRLDAVGSFEGGEVGLINNITGQSETCTMSDKAQTLKVAHGHAVQHIAYSFDGGVSTGQNGVVERGRLLDAVTDTHILDDQGGSVINVRTDGQAPTLRAQMGGHPPVVMTSGGFCPEQSARTRGHAVVAYERPPHYIVRRLTPTECARLQGFPDIWGRIEKKDALTAEEYRFWLEVRNTHAAINGKAVKDYTPKQMLTWYNKLWTDSAEYKMWGNGIALPPALYCLQGILDVLTRATVADQYDIPEELLREEDFACLL